jgi:hypothetical protein
MVISMALIYSISSPVAVLVRCVAFKIVSWKLLKLEKRSDFFFFLTKFRYFKTF